MQRLISFSDEVWSESSQFYDLGYIWIPIVNIPQNWVNLICEKFLNYRYETHDWRRVDDRADDFSQNDRRVRFSDCADGAKQRIAIRWLNFILDQHEIAKEMEIRVIGIEKEKLNLDNFGPKDGKRNCRIYARMMRSSLEYSIKKTNHEIFDCLPVIHRGNQEHEENFENILTKSDREILNPYFQSENHRKFRGSDKEKFKVANMIQVSDLIGGCVANLFNNRKIDPRKEHLCVKIKDSIRKSLEGEKSPINVAFYPDKEWEGPQATYRFHKDKDISRK